MATPPIQLPPDERLEEAIELRLRKITTVHYEWVPDSAPSPGTIIRYEDWDDTQVYDGESNDPARMWTYGADPDATKVSANVVDDIDFGHALELAIQAVHGQTAGIRVFPTTSGRWDLFVDYIGKPVIFSTVMKIVQPLLLDERDGTKGLWTSVGIQVKDAVPGAQATFAMNVRPEREGNRLWIQFPHGTVEELFPVYLPDDGTPIELDLHFVFASNSSGEADLYVDQKLAFRCRGRTGNPNNGGGNFSLTLYGNSLVQPTAVRFGAVDIRALEALG